MIAKVGDRIIVRGRRVGDTTRSGVVVAVRGADGTPPYVVRWDGDTTDHIYYPGADAIIG